MSTAGSLDTSLNLLELIILNDKSAKTKINDALKNSHIRLQNIVQFRFYFKHDDDIGCDYCDCWFINEYFEYINADNVDIELFESVIDNVRRGHCPHVDPNSTNNIKWSGISLIHAAAAVGSETVTKYLLTKNKRLKYSTTTFAKLPPVIIAVLKNQSGIMKHLHVEVKQSSNSDSVSSKIKSTMLNHLLNRLDLNGMVVAARTEEHHKVKLLKHIGYWNTNPFAAIFFAGIAPTEAMIEILMCYLNAEEILKGLQHLLYRQERQVATDIVYSFSKRVDRFNAELVLECILWDNPEALNIILSKFKAGVETLQYAGFSFVSIADFLNHTECARILEDFCLGFDDGPEGQRCVQGTDQMEQTTTETVKSPYYVILRLSDDHNYDSQSTCKLLTKISNKRFDINYKDKYGFTAVDTSLQNDRGKYHSRAVLETLLGQGADANLIGANGTNALCMTLEPYCFPMSHMYMSYTFHFIDTMKTALYYNAVPAYTRNVLYHALDRDSMNSLLPYIYDPSATVILSNQSPTAKTVIVKTTREKYLALSAVAILIELGFIMENNFENEQISLLDKLPSEMKHYINETLGTPRSLLLSSRNVIRKTYPGPQLQRFLNVANIPGAIADTILFKPYLFRTKVCLASGKIIEGSDGKEYRESGGCCF